MKRLVVLLAAAAVLLSAACGAVTPFAAIVNGERVTQSDLDTELKALKSNKAFVESLQAQGTSIEGTAKGTFDMAFVSRVLTRRIFFALIHQEVERRKLEITPDALTEARRATQDSFGGAEAFQDFPESYVKEATQTTADITALQADVGKGEATPARIKEYYDSHTTDFMSTCVSHILVDDEQKAKDLKAQIDGGADFAALARTESKDNANGTGGSAAKGGSLDCITAAAAASFVPEFVAGYKDLAVGAVSPPVKSEFGFHIIKVTEKKQQSLEEATAAITQQLGGDIEQQFNDLIMSLAKKAKIRVNPKYGTFDAEQLTVVPPDAPPAAGTATTTGAEGVIQLPSQ